MTGTIADRLEILELISRYYTAVDSEDTETWVALWAEDGSYEAPFATAKGRVALKEFLVDHYPMSRGKRHLYLNPIVDVEAEKAIATTLLVVIRTGSPPPAIMASAFCNWEFVKVNQIWKLARHWFTLDPSWQ